MTIRIPTLVLTGMVMSALGGSNALAADQGNQRNRFVTKLSGAEEVRPVDTATRARAVLRFIGNRAALSYRLVVVRGENITVAHLHCAPPGVSGSVVADLMGEITGGLDGRIDTAGTLTDANVIEDAGCSETIGREITSIADLAEAVNRGEIYVNVHSEQNPEGEVRGQVPAGRSSGQVGKISSGTAVDRGAAADGGYTGGDQAGGNRIRVSESSETVSRNGQVTKTETSTIEKQP